jgi:hypothetical protein
MTTVFVWRISLLQGKAGRVGDEGVTERVRMRTRAIHGGTGSLGGDKGGKQTEALVKRVMNV